jgi:hypothetical protein
LLHVWVVWAAVRLGRRWEEHRPWEVTLLAIGIFTILVVHAERLWLGSQGTSVYCLPEWQEEGVEQAHAADGASRRPRRTEWAAAASCSAFAEHRRRS